MAPELGMFVMAGFLGLAALAQINDPDSSVWIAVYAVPAALTLWACLVNTGRLWLTLCVMVLLGISLFGYNVIYNAIKNGKIENEIITSEEGRESAGVLIVILWLMLLLLYQRMITWFSYGMLAFAVVPPSAWIAYKLYHQEALNLPQHCKGLI